MFIEDINLINICASYLACLHDLINICASYLDNTDYMDNYAIYCLGTWNLFNGRGICFSINERLNDLFDWFLKKHDEKSC